MRVQYVLQFIHLPIPHFCKEHTKTCESLFLKRLSIRNQLYQSLCFRMPWHPDEWPIIVFATALWWFFSPLPKIVTMLLKVLIGRTHTRENDKYP